MRSELQDYEKWNLNNFVAAQHRIRQSVRHKSMLRSLYAIGIYWYWFNGLQNPEIYEEY